MHTDTVITITRYVSDPWWPWGFIQWASAYSTGMFVGWAVWGRRR